VSPDGQKLIFEDSHLVYGIQEVPLNGGAPLPLSSTDQWEFDPAWSPAAQQLAYVTDRNGPNEIWLKSVQEGWSRPLVTPGEFSDSTAGFAVPVFSPDGSRIAYMRYTSPNANGAVRIWISSTSGGTPVRLTHETAAVVEGTPAWSPDGSSLAYTRYEGGNRSLVKLRLGSLNPPLVLRPKSQVAAPAWSPTGQWITFLSENGDWMLVSPDGMSERKLGPLKTDYLLWSQDGKTLYGIEPNKSQRQVLFALDVASGRQKDVQDLGTEFYPYGPWTSSRRWSLAPDGKSFATPVRHVRSDLWMLEGFNSRQGWFSK
jgi:Tol biopolymer transport system component